MNNSSLNTANAYRLTYSNASTGANLSRDDSTKLPYAEKAESEGSRASMACAEMRMTEAQPTPLSQIDSLEAQIRHDGATAVFFQAAKEGHYETIRHMLPRWDVDPRAFDSACLQETTKSDEPSNTTTLRLLLEDGRANPLANNGRALWHAALGGNVEPLKLLLADPRVLGNPELIRKTFCGLYSGLYRTNPQRCDPVTLEPYMVARNAQQGLTRHAECLSLFIKTGHIQFNELREAIYVATSLHSIDLARALLNQPTLYQQGKIPDFSVGTDGFRNRDSHYLSIHKQSSYYSYDGSIINERNSAKSVIIKWVRLFSND